MNSLEDAYVNMAKEEEKLFNEDNPHMVKIENEDIFSDYLSIQGKPNFFF